MTASGPGRVLFEFVRHWSRRSTAGDHPAGDQGRLVLVTEAVHSLAERGIAATVNAVAHEIGIDQSGASRLVKSATEAGYLTLEPSEADGRYRRASVTLSGDSMLELAHAWQEQVFDRLTEGWSRQRRHDFERAMTDLMERSWKVSADRG